jgi:hypothetical protein
MTHPHLFRLGHAPLEFLILPIRHTSFILFPIFKMVSPPYTFPTRPICVDCELLSLGGTLESLAVTGEPVITGIRRQRIFCDTCMTNARLQTAKRYIELDLNINQISLLEFAFFQFSWEEGKYGKPLLVMDVFPLPDDVFWCDDCYLECFNEYPFFDIEDNRLVFYYRYCGSCSQQIRGIQ